MFLTLTSILTLTTIFDLSFGLGKVIWSFLVV